MVARAKRAVMPLRHIDEPGEGATAYSREVRATPAFKEMVSTQQGRRRSFERSGNIRTGSGVVDLRGDLESEYERRGWHDLEAQHAAAAPSMHDYGELAVSGFNPFPQPKRWEHLSSEQHGRAIAGLRAHGTTLEKMTGDLGRSLDRAYSRASEYGPNVTPYASNFYEPRGHARVTMRGALPDITDVQQAAGIAMTSPKNKFIQVTGEGETQTPNVNAAVTAAHFAGVGREQGWGPEEYRSIPGEALNARGRQVGGGGVGIHGNTRRAAYAISQGSSGVSIENWRGFPRQDNPAGEDLFGGSPKASPFAGSFIDRAAPFHVTDVMMAGIVFPHLSGIKGSGTNINPSGADTGTKSERELAVERIPHSHAAVDYAMRQAMAERGLSKLRYNQGAGWGEEQISRSIQPEPGARRLGYEPEKMYGWQSSFTRRTKRGTGSLWLPNS